MTKEELRNHLSDILNDEPLLPKEQALDAYTEALWQLITNEDNLK